ncbi:MAG: hypothetical protein ACP6IY_20005 [Promethearchaeia archaeon]
MTQLVYSLVSILNEFIENTQAFNASLITEDGLIITTNDNKEFSDKSSSIAAISASILSMAERGIEAINKNKMLEQIKIEAGLQNNSNKDFTILISRVFSNVLIQIIFPRKINLGLIHFELTKIIKKIKNLIQNQEGEQLLTDLGSLL